MKAAIFDFNGTLFFDTDKHKEAWKGYGEALRKAPVTEDDFQSSMLGRTSELILAFLLGRMPTPEETFKMGREKEALYRKLCLADPDSFHLAPGAAEYLDQLKASCIPCTIATSTDRENLEFYFKHFNLDRWFDINLCIYEDGSFKGKPYPDIYLKAASVLNYSPSDCTVFEDASSGIRAAFSAGAGKIIAVASSAPKNVLAQCEGVTQVISDYNELL